MPGELLRSNTLLSEWTTDSLGILVPWHSVRSEATVREGLFGIPTGLSVFSWGIHGSHQLQSPCTPPAAFAKPCGVVLSLEDAETSGNHLAKWLACSRGAITSTLQQGASCACGHLVRRTECMLQSLQMAQVSHTLLPFRLRDTPVH